MWWRWLPSEIVRQHTIQQLWCRCGCCPWSRVKGCSRITMIYSFTLRWGLQLIVNFNNQVSYKLMRLVKSLPKSIYKLINKIGWNNAYIAHHGSKCSWRQESRHDEFLLLDHTLSSSLVAWKEFPSSFLLLMLDLSLESLVVLLRYVIVLSIDNVLGVNLRCI